MPVYAFKCECGRKGETMLPVTAAGHRIKCICGARMERDFKREHSTQDPSGTWPMKSDALAVHPLDAKNAEKDARARGVPTEFTKGGEPVFTGPGHRKEYCEKYRVYDRNGSYGDPRRR